MWAATFLEHRMLRCRTVSRSRCPRLERVFHRRDTMQSHLPNPAVDRSRTGRTPPASASDDLGSLAMKPRLDRSEAAGNTSYADAELFDCGTLLKLNMHALCSPQRESNIVLRAYLVVLVGWVPLLLLSAYQTLSLATPGWHRSFLISPSHAGRSSRPPYSCLQSGFRFRA